MYQKHTWVSKEVIRREYLQNIEDGIYNEQERAIAAENALSGSISDETSRAVVKENALSASILELTNNLTSETSRATAKENAIESALNDEIDRATAAETTLAGTVNTLSNDLSDETSRAITRENAINSALTTETTRATTAEQTLTTNLSNEVTRATQAENSLREYVDTKVSVAYKASGSIYFADLPPLAESRIGNVYDIKDDFTTTSDFAEGAGKDYKAGTNVAISLIETSSYTAVTPTGNENPSAKGWYEKNGSNYVLTTDTEVNSSKTYYTNKVIKYDALSAMVTGGGHTIVDANGTEFTQRSNLKFVNASVSDDAANDQTIVTPSGASDAYTPSDAASTTINNTDYVPMLEGTTRKKTLWSTIIAKIKSALATVATTGSYNDLSDKPTIPTVNNATLTIQKNGTNVQTFTANSSTNKTANITMAKSDVGLGNVANLDQSKAIKSISRSGTTFTATALDGTTSTFTQQDNNTTYAAGTGVTISGSNNAINVTYGSAASTACQGNDSRLSNSRTPTSHASTGTGYGAGNASNYGHVKLSDTYTSNVGAAANSIGASQTALYNVYTTLTGQRKWNVITTITDTSSHSLNISNYKELLVVIYQNLNGTWRGVNMSIALENAEPYNQNVYLYSGAYLGTNSYTGGQIRYNYDGTTATINLVQFVVNGTSYTSGIAMKVFGR